MESGIQDQEAQISAVQDHNQNHVCNFYDLSYRILDGGNSF